MSDAAVHNMTIPHAGTSLKRLGALFSRWQGRQRERQSLARFSRRELQDIGLTPADVQSELSKPFWRG